MNFFNFLKRQKTDVESYYEEREKNDRKNLSQTDAVDFRMAIKDVFSITGRGTVATGTVSSGTLRIGDAVTLLQADGTERVILVKGLELFRKMVAAISAGDNAGILLADVSHNEVHSGDILYKGERP